MTRVDAEVQAAEAEERAARAERERLAAEQQRLEAERRRREAADLHAEADEIDPDVDTRTDPTIDEPAEAGRRPRAGRGPGRTPTDLTQIGPMGDRHG